MGEVIEVGFGGVAPRARSEEPGPTPYEVINAPEPPDEMVWGVCHVTRPHGCDRCPAWEASPYGTMQPGCYRTASLQCRVVFAMQARTRT